MKKEILSGHKNFKNILWSDLEFIMDCIHLWEQTRLSNGNTYLIEYSTRNYTRTYKLKDIIC